MLYGTVSHKPFMRYLNNLFEELVFIMLITSVAFISVTLIFSMYLLTSSFLFLWICFVDLFLISVECLAHFFLTFLISCEISL